MIPKILETSAGFDDILIRLYVVLFYKTQNLTVPPQVAPFIIGEEPANWGEQVSVICNVLKGDYPIEIKWTLNGEKINPKKHPDIRITKDGKKISFLVIDAVADHHAGEYACIASNLVGNSSRSAVLAVNGIFNNKKRLK